MSAGMITKFMAVSSSPLGKVRMIANRPTGIIMAAPAPCRMRDATSVDSTKVSGGVSVDEARAKRDGYLRAMSACLEGRGYSVK